VPERVGAEVRDLAVGAVSVQLLELRDPEFETVELMSPDFDMDYFWLWPAPADVDQRIDLSRKQILELRDWLNKEFPK
jgi:hypothetical protein